MIYVSYMTVGPDGKTMNIIVSSDKLQGTQSKFVAVKQ